MYTIVEQLDEIDLTYSEDELIKLETTVAYLKDKFISTLFLNKDEALTDEKFLSNVTLPENSWVFDASQIRTRLAQLANIEPKHLESLEQSLKRYNSVKSAKEELAMKM